MQQQRKGDGDTRVVPTEMTTPPAVASATPMHTGVWRIIHARGAAAKPTAFPTAADSIGLFGYVVTLCRHKLGLSASYRKRY